MLSPLWRQPPRLGACDRVPCYRCRCGIRATGFFGATGVDALFYRARAAICWLQSAGHLSAAQSAVRKKNSEIHLASRRRSSVGVRVRMSLLAFVRH